MNVHKIFWQWVNLNLCLYCGENGHEHQSCPNKAKKKNLNLLELASVRFQDDLREDSLFITICLTFRDETHSTEALIDSGANSNFISQDFVNSNSLPVIKLPESIAVRMADGRVSSITHYLPLVNLKAVARHRNHSSVVDLLVVRDLKYPCILGIPWLSKANPIIDWAKGSLKFKELGDFVNNPY